MMKLKLKTDEEVLRRVAAEQIQAIVLAAPKGEEMTRENLRVRLDDLLTRPVTDKNLDLALERLVTREILASFPRRPGVFRRITPTDPYQAALDRLVVDPGKCPIEGCGKLLLCCSVEAWDGDADPMPTPRFCCPIHDVWLGECFDDGDPDDEQYSEGVYEAVLRDPSAPAWLWAPEPHRAAIARAGFGVISTTAYPAMQVGTGLGMTWVKDRSNLIAVGAADDFARMIEEVTPTVSPVSARAAVMVEHIYPADRMDARLESFTGEAFSAANVGKASEHGHSEPWDAHHVAIGERAIPTRIFDLVSALHPDATWFSNAQGDVVIAAEGDRPVAFIAWIDTVAWDKRFALNRRRAAGEVCPAQHHNYTCDLAKAHEGTVHHQMVASGGAAADIDFEWDEAEFPRTDEPAPEAERSIKAEVVE